MLDICGFIFVYIYLPTMSHKKVLSFFKHVFIPHSGNDYKPHFLREHVLLSIFITSLLLLLLSFTTYIVIRTTTFGSSVVSYVLVDLTNQTRKKNGVPTLSYNQKLYTAAKMKGQDMAMREYFSHFAPDGTSPWHWFSKAGYAFVFAGENLAINFNSSKEVERAWLLSPKHRDNILDPRYKDIGIATVPGFSNSKLTLFVVQLFGTERVAIASSTSEQRESVRDVRFYEKIIFNLSYYISTIYIVVITILIVAILLMIFIEIKKQHYLHVIFGVLLTCLVILCLIINSMLL